MIRLILDRKKHSDKQTIGTIEVWNNNEFILSLVTLEQEWNNNEISNSCIPIGEYNVNHYSSSKYPNVLILHDTKPRTKILIHSGNYNTHTKGCILVGLTHSDINNDGYLDVVSSRTALKKLMQICKNETNISIIIS